MCPADVWVVSAAVPASVFLRDILDDQRQTFFGHVVRQPSSICRNLFAFRAVRVCRVPFEARGEIS